MAKRSPRRRKKATPKSKAPRKKTGRKRARRARRRRPVLRWALRVTVLLMVVAAAYVVYLDFDLRRQFEGRRWEVPARVYARPLELFAGRRLSAADFARELGLLRYRKVARPTEPGTYRRNGREFVLVTRPFTFWDGREVSRRVRVRFDDGRVAALADPTSGASHALVRLDPALIAGIYPAHREDRILVRLENVPELLTRGLMAVEDRKFRSHHGLDFRAIARALWANLRAGHTVQGGSTLTQQLAKNYFLTNERTLWRKANEAVMALLLEWHYDKDEILEAYLNEVYLGQDGDRSIHGFGLASQFYFQRPLESLAPDQIALLVGLVRGPSYYDPRRHPDRARARRDRVLGILGEQGVLTAEQVRRARARPLGVSKRAPSGVTYYPAFLDLVRRQLRRDYRDVDLRSEGLQIFTTLDPTVQHHAEAALVEHIGRLERDLGKGVRLEGAVVITRTDDGEVQAVVGGRRPRFAGFNRALDAVRPVGSLIKPAVYLTALAQPKRFSLATLLDDSRLAVPTREGEAWVPRNYDRRYHGEVPLYQALAHSYNVATARLGQQLGIARVADTLRRLGVQRPVNSYPAMVLGSVELTPVEVAQMYQTIAGGGFRTPLRSIRAVLTADGEPLGRYPLTVERAFDEQTMYLLTHALQRVAREGTAAALARSLLPGVAVAGKTGTTDELRDSWFAGFSQDYLAVVWLGQDDNKPTGLTGSSGALRVWAALFRRLDPRSLDPAAPTGVTFAWIDPASGRQTARDCQGAVQLPFAEGGAVPEPGAPCRGRAGNWLRRIIP